MFQYPGKLTIDQYTRPQTIRWLNWLAVRMVQYAQTEFLIERIQPYWIQSLNQRKTPVRLIMFMWGPLYGMILGLSMGLFFGLIAVQRGEVAITQSGSQLDGPIPWVTSVLFIGLFFGAMPGFILGLIFGLNDWLGGELNRIGSTEQLSGLWKRLQSNLYAGSFWLITAFCFGPSNSATVKLLAGLTGGLIGGFKPIKPVRRVRLTWEELKINLLFGLTFGLLFGVSYGFILSSIEGLRSTLIVNLIFGTLLGLVGGLVFGLFFESETNLANPKIITTQIPNQGLKQTAKLSLTLGLISMLLVWLGLWLIGGRVKVDIGEFSGIGVWLVSGLAGSLFGGLFGGSDLVMKHIILRFSLYCRHYAPINYASFLDYCADRILLRKVGGGYVFIHRLLMEHFAAMGEDDIERIVKASNVN